MRILFFIMLIFVLTSCEEDTYLTENSNNKITLSLKPFEGQATRSGNDSRIKKIHYYIIDANNRIQKMPYSSIAPDMSYIRVENLKDGTYRLIVSGESSTSEKGDVLLTELKNVTDNWIICNGDRVAPLQCEYYYADHHFSVKDGAISDKEVELSRIVGKVYFNIRSTSDLVASGAIKKVEIVDVQNGVYASMTGNGEFGNEKLLSEKIEIKSNRELMFLPSIPGKPIKGRLAITSLCLDGTLATSTYMFQTDIVANHISTINIDYKHPDDNNRLLYVPFSKYNTDNSAFILSNTEPKSVYYNSKERSFNVKSPLQYGIDSKNKFFVKFYSAVGIANVKFIWSSDTEEVEFARFDTIPPFFEAAFTHPLSLSGGVMQTTDGRIVECKALPNMASAGLRLSMQCNDPYMQKIKTIIPSIVVSFSAYGGNPDAANGAPNGNWMGIRPVHIREACAAWTNMAFMVSTPDFVNTITQNAPSGVYTDNNKGAVAASTIINQYRSNRTIIAGLIWTGKGVVGLGGGTTWGVSQNVYFNHYTDSHTMWHEFSHCVGYSHTSSMTYGPFAETHCKGLYNSMCASKRMPVSNRSILNSANNSNKY